MSRLRFFSLCSGLAVILFLLYRIKTSRDIFVFQHGEHLYPTENTTPSTMVSSQTFSPTSFLNRSKIATLIEPRSEPLLLPVIHNFLALLPADWPILIWCSIVNEELLRGAKSLQAHIQSGKVEIRLLPDGPSQTRLETVSLSKLLTDSWYWNQFHEEAEWMLIFQSDSVLCSHSQLSLDDWLGYDFVGGPTDWASDGYGGNGGLSIRKISSMKRITEELKERARSLGKEREFLWPQDWFDKPELRNEHYYTSEDVYFIDMLKKMRERSPELGIRWPKDDGRDQADFSLDIWNPKRPDHERRPWGVHIGANIQPYVVRYENGEFTPKSQALVDYCPEVLMLRFGMALPDKGRQAVHEIAAHPE